MTGRRTALPLLATVVALAALLTACGGKSGAGSSGTPSPSTKIRSLQERCGTKPSVPADALTFESGNGARLYGAEMGDGPRGLVLVHQVGSEGMCGWLHGAEHFAGKGYHVLLFDQVCYGDSACPSGASLAADVPAAASKLRHLGAASVVAVGASQGGGVVVVAAAHHPKAFDGVVVLSGQLDARFSFSAPHTAQDAAPKVTAPILFAIARKDDVATVAQTRAVARSTASKHRQVVVLPMTMGHGIDLVTDIDGKPTRFDRKTLLPFLAERTAA
ncbi:MAG: alpha/beta hydrolase [Streptosporangiales bacterium]